MMRKGIDIYVLFFLVIPSGLLDTLKGEAEKKERISILE